MRAEPLIVRPALLLASVVTVFFGLILLNGYLLEMADRSADANAILVLLLIESAGCALMLRRARLRLAGNHLELAAWLLVVVEVWIYFLVPAWPTLLPPSFSGDAANHQGFADAIYATGRIFGDYPGGSALVTATLAHWLGWLPLRLEHLITGLWMALTAGGVYGIACELLPDRREFKLAALVGPFALFVPWAFFAGAVLGYQYFLTQVQAQFFLVSLLWLLIAYRSRPHLFWAAGMSLCLIAISVTFQLWLALAIAQMGLGILAEWRERGLGAARTLVIGVMGAPILFWLAIFLFAPRFIPQLSRFQAAGVVLTPTVEILGGPFLILPAAGWLLLVLRRSLCQEWLVAGFSALAVLQILAGVAANLWLGVAAYWVGKTFYVLVFALALCGTIPAARAIGWIVERHAMGARTAVAGLVVVFGLYSAGLWLLRPPPVFSPLSEATLQVALWAKNHLNTRQVNYVGRKSLAAHWLLVGVWNERVPDDLLIDFATVGPKTLEEWRDAPGWGNYLLISNDQFGPLGSTVRTVYSSGNMALVERVTLPNPPDPAMRTARFGDALYLRGSTLPVRTAQPGDVISFTAEIETAQVPLHQVAWRLELRGPQSERLLVQRSDPFNNQFPLQRWPEGRVLAQPFRLDLPQNLAPGRYGLELGLDYVTSGDAVPVQTDNGAADERFQLAWIKIPAPRPAAADLAGMVRSEARLGDTANLLGFRLENGATVRSGDPLRIVLFWEGGSNSPKDYTFFVHLIDAAGRVAAQHDSRPLDGTYPTSIWDEGEIVTDHVALDIPSTAPAGEYRVAVGMYDWPGLNRLAVTGSDGRVLGDQFVLPGVVNLVHGRE